jgi:6-phosphogluconolactonase
MHTLHLRSFLVAILMAVSLLSTVFVFSPVSHVFATSRSSSSGHVYVLNNATSANSISAFNRASDGTLTLIGTTNLGGQGTGSPLNSQGSLIFSADKHWLFAVNAGSNQISVLSVGSQGNLSLASVSSSHGIRPVSLTFTSNHLYVVNAGNSSHSGNVTGFFVGTNGTLQALTGSTQPLSGPNPAPVQIQADPSGGTLLVTESFTNLIDTYAIHSNGSLDAPKFAHSAGAVPFGFAFDPVVPSLFIVSNVGSGQNAGAMTSYLLQSGLVIRSYGPVADNQTAACWVVITNNGNFTYTTNAGSGSVSGYQIGTNGKLTLFTTVSTGTNSNPNEEALTSDGNFLYIIDPGTSTLSAFQVQQNGGLVNVHLSNITLSTGITGLAAD